MPTPVPSTTDVIEAIAQAIAKFEGFYLTPEQCKRRGLKWLDADGVVHYQSLAQRNNNPGNLRSWGTMPIRAGYAVFPSIESGFRALRQQILRNIHRKLTFLEFFAGKKGVYPGYAPAADSNHPATYAGFVCGMVNQSLSIPTKLKATPTTPIPSLIGCISPGAEKGGVKSRGTRFWAVTPTSSPDRPLSQKATAKEKT